VNECDIKSNVSRRHCNNIALDSPRSPHPLRALLDSNDLRAARQRPTPSTRSLPRHDMHPSQFEQKNARPRKSREDLSSILAMALAASLRPRPMLSTDLETSFDAPLTFVVTM
jgi:hypothetical protein